MLSLLVELLAQFVMEVLGWRMLLCLLAGFMAAFLVLQHWGHAPLQWVVAVLLVAASAAVGRIWDVATRE